MTQAASESAHDGQPSVYNFLPVFQDTYLWLQTQHAEINEAARQITAFEYQQLAAQTPSPNWREAMKPRFVTYSPQDGDLQQDLNDRRSHRDALRGDYEKVRLGCMHELQLQLERRRISVVPLHGTPMTYYPSSESVAENRFGAIEGVFMSVNPESAKISIIEDGATGGWYEITLFGPTGESLFAVDLCAV